MRRHTYHREEAADDAFDERGILKDGKSFRVPLHMRDSLSPLQREVSAFAASVTSGPHRPGFRHAVADAERTSALDAAYSSYERDLTTAWQGTASRADAAAEHTCPDCDGSGHDDHRRCKTCGGTGAVSADYETRHDQRSVQQATQDHQQAMAEVYGGYDAALSEAWRT